MPRLPVVLFAALLGLTACGKTGEAATDEPRTTVRVENRNFLDMHVYVAQAGGSRVRLGIVSGGGTKVFTVPAYLVRGAGSLRFLVDPIGSAEEGLSEELPVIPGDEVMLIIPSR